MRLVLVKDKSYAVYENKQCIAAYELQHEQRYLTPEEVEELRIAEHKELA